MSTDVWKALKKTSCKCDDQQQYKTILEAVMVSTTEGCTDNSPMTPNQYYPTKNLLKEKYFVNFQKHCMSSIRLMFTG